MSNLPALSGLGELASGRIGRQASREITRSRAYGAAVSARRIVKVEALAQITEAALLATSHVSAVEALLVSRTPHAEARLRHIADAGCTGMASVVLSTGEPHLMLLLALIGLAQLAVLVMILALIAGQASQHQSEQQLAEERIRGIQHQTIEAMVTTADDVTDQAGRRVYPGR